MIFQDVKLDDAQSLNAGLYARFMELLKTDCVRQSHHFEGRFENIYINKEAIPEIGAVLHAVKLQASQFLGIPKDRLKIGFWFNAMEAGHRTTLHHHDENDELCSAVYYINVPENSGDLVLRDGSKEVVIQPKAGRLVMFAPNVLHEVTVNRSAEMRLSVGMNVGPKN